MAAQVSPLNKTALSEGTHCFMRFSMGLAQQELEGNSTRVENFLKNQSAKNSSQKEKADFSDFASKLLSHNRINALRILEETRYHIASDLGHVPKGKGRQEPNARITPKVIQSISKELTLPSDAKAWNGLTNTIESLKKAENQEWSLDDWIEYHQNAVSSLYKALEGQEKVQRFECACLDNPGVAGSLPTVVTGRAVVRNSIDLANHGIPMMRRDITPARVQ